jgi:uncharacterized repeat protein (TIGR03833 family)
MIEVKDHGRNPTHQHKPGLAVRIVLKKDQRSGHLTEGVVKDILTKSPTHPHGIKVRLENGAIGRVKEIHTLNACCRPISSKESILHADSYEGPIRRHGKHPGDVSILIIDGLDKPDSLYDQKLDISARAF